MEEAFCRVFQEAPYLIAMATLFPLATGELRRGRGMFHGAYLLQILTGSVLQTIRHCLPLSPMCHFCIRLRYGFRLTAFQQIIINYFSRMIFHCTRKKKEP